MFLSRRRCEWEKTMTLLRPRVEVICFTGFFHSLFPIDHLHTYSVFLEIQLKTWECESEREKKKRRTEFEERKTLKLTNQREKALVVKGAWERKRDNSSVTEQFAGIKSFILVNDSFKNRKPKRWKRRRKEVTQRRKRERDRVRSSNLEPQEQTHWEVRIHWHSKKFVHRTSWKKNRTDSLKVHAN